MSNAETLKAMAERLHASGTPSDMPLYVWQEGKEPVRYEENDFPLGKACDLSGEGSCDSCQ